ncbi:MAG: TolC family protein [Bdellovibrionota bacterium]
MLTRDNLLKPLSTLTAFALAMQISAAAFAAPDAALAAKPRNVVVNPASLRTMLVRSNYGVLENLNLIHQAKDQVNIARGNLMPRLNLGAILSGIVTGPAFALQSVSILLPFLLPSNWANLHQSEDLLESQKIGYRLVELNNYASAYALYTTMQGDSAIRDVVVSEYNDFVTVRDYLINQQKFVGNVPQEDIDRADAQVNSAAANVSATDELLVSERAALREALALDLSVNLSIDTTQVPASAGEGLDVIPLAKKISSLAPENAQMVYMVKAAQEVKYSKEFSFFSGASLSASAGSGNTPAFNSLSSGAQFSIGFDYIPNIDLASDNIKNLQIHENELVAQQGQLAESTLLRINEAKKQVVLQTKAETEDLGVFRAEFRKYTLGLTDLLNVIDAERTAASDTAAKVKAQTDLNTLRVTLHRELLTDQFASIPGCRIKPAAEEKDKNWLGRLFSPKDYSISIDEACGPAI